MDISLTPLFTQPQLQDSEALMERALEKASLAYEIKQVALAGAAPPTDSKPFSPASPEALHAIGVPTPTTPEHTTSKQDEEASGAEQKKRQKARTGTCAGTRSSSGPACISQQCLLLCQGRWLASLRRCFAPQAVPWDTNLCRLLSALSA